MKYVCIASFYNYTHAHIALGILLDEYINCFLDNELSNTLEPFIATGNGGIRLMVAATQQERAEQLLKEIRFEE